MKQLLIAALALVIFATPAFADEAGGGSSIVFIFVTIAFCILIFLLLREFWCWFWKINERIAILKEQNAILKRIEFHGQKPGQS